MSELRDDMNTGFTAFDRLLSKIVSVTVEFGTDAMNFLFPDLEETEVEKKYDRRLFLKIKLKNLRDEVYLIRSHEEQLIERLSEPAGTSGVHRQSLLKQMQDHRRKDLREEARVTLLAYGYIRGRTYDQIETNPRHEYYMTVKKRVERVAKMVNKYSVMDGAMWSQEKAQELIRVWMGVDEQGNRLQKKIDSSESAVAA